MSYHFKCLFLLVALSGCGSVASNNTLGGSAGRSYDLGFDHVEIYHQTISDGFSIQVKYVAIDEDGNESWPAILVVENPEVNVSADLTESGNRLYRVTPPTGTVTYDVVQGSAVFSSLGEPGQHVSGSFGSELEGGSSLNGEFSASLQSLDD